MKSLLMRGMLLLTLTAAVIATPTAAEGKEPVGRYRLVGQMETAAELELRKDGRFRWLYSVGGLDMDVQGDWKRMHSTVILKADKADAMLEKVIALEGIARTADLLPTLAADHPLRAQPNAIAVHMVNLGGLESSALYAFALDEAGEPIAWQASVVDEGGRWFTGELPAGKTIKQIQLVLSRTHVSEGFDIRMERALATEGLLLTRYVDIALKPGEMAEFVVSEEALQDEARMLMMSLKIAKDGSLLPGGQSDDESASRYVRD